MCAHGFALLKSSTHNLKEIILAIRLLLKAVGGRIYSGVFDKDVKAIGQSLLVPSLPTATPPAQHTCPRREVAVKKEPDSDEEEKKEEEGEEEEEEVAVALDSNDVSCEQVDTYACDHAKQGIERQVASDNHKDSVSKGTNGCESA
jgi:hypothetical protein